MKNIVACVIVFLFPGIGVFAQVGINTDNSTPDPSAMLDVKSTDKGILIPRMTQVQRNSIASPAKGLMIYQTDTSPGFYFNFGDGGSPEWKIFGTGSGWGLTGNSGTNPETNFLGTIDSQPLKFKVSNELAGYLDYDITKSNTGFGYQSLNSLTSGNNNTVVGYQALLFNSTGYYNTAHGAGALKANTSGYGNTAFGCGTLLLNTTGSENTAFGYNAGLAFGNLTNAAAIGANASVSANNSFVLGSIAGVNGATSSVNVGIGTRAPASVLHLQSANLADAPRADLILSRYWASLTDTRASAIFHYYNSATLNDNLAFAVSGDGGSTGQPNQLPQIKMIIQADGKVGLGTTTPAKMLDVNGDALINGITVGRGGGNIFHNTAIGVLGLASNTDGSYNTATGSQGLASNTDGSDNTANGFSALVYNTGNYNTAIGSQALWNNSTGSENSAIGYIANVGLTNLTNATAIGARSYVSASNSLVLGSIAGVNGAASSVKVGIGTSAPDAPLHVSGSAMTSPSLSRVYFWQPGGTSLYADVGVSGAVQVHANGWFWADGGGFVATSDARIKNIIGRSNTKDDLDILTQIEVTDYRYIDQISNSSLLQKKVIAQQLKEIYPVAVNQNTGVIPNVFETAVNIKVTGNSTLIETKKPHGFKSGDMVKLILEHSGEKTIEVLVNDDHTFSIAEPINDKIFVYGKKVNDLLNVDYDAVSMLNVSATQELVKQLEEMTEQNALLRNSISLLENQVQILSVKVDAITAESTVQIDKTR